MHAAASGSTDSNGFECAREALEHARDAIPITRWRLVVQALRLRPEQVRGVDAFLCPDGHAQDEETAVTCSTGPLHPYKQCLLCASHIDLSCELGKASIHSSEALDICMHRNELQTRPLIVAAGSW
jgi:hypothetical protein